MSEKEQLEDIILRAEDLFDNLSAGSLKDVTVQLGCFLAIFLDYAKMRMDICNQQKSPAD